MKNRRMLAAIEDLAQSEFPKRIANKLLPIKLGKDAADNTVARYFNTISNSKKLLIKSY